MKERVQGIKLNVKFTIICLFFVMIPMIGLSGWLFRNMEVNVIDEKANAMLYKLEKGHDQVIKSIDSVNMSTQFFLSDQKLKGFLVAEKNGDKYSTEELMDFYNRDVASLERMVNNNSTLYQIRIYVDSSSLQEMMPILYRMERMKKQSFYSDEKLCGWKFGYEDNLFEGYGKLTGEREIVSLITSMSTYREGEIGVLEVAMYMDTMFPIIYDSTETEWSCFVDGEGNIYFEDRFDTVENRTLIVDILNENKEQVQDNLIYNQRVSGDRLIIGYQKISELDGVLISVNDISKDLGGIYSQRTLFIFIGLVVMILLALVVNQVVMEMLKQFYSILHSIREVQAGDLDVVIENCGKDEMGELGNQINEMLVSIKQLTDDNLNHELLVKNTEIRALQNQINAHFIYNVLESIKMMAEIEEKFDISDSITALGRLLRYSMRWTSGNVTVAEELEYIRNYLKLINLRFDYEIYLSESLTDTVLKQEIPKMSLQPIVENAIYHGIEQLAEDTAIYIKGTVDNQDCLIEITDSGRGMSEEEVEKLYKKISGEIEASGGSGNGIGLKNVQDRIKMNFGDQYGIEISSKLGCYTKIIVHIPVTRSFQDELSEGDN